MFIVFSIDYVKTFGAPRHFTVAVGTIYVLLMHTILIDYSCDHKSIKSRFNQDYVKLFESAGSS